MKQPGEAPASGEGTRGPKRRRNSLGSEVAAGADGGARVAAGETSRHAAQAEAADNTSERRRNTYHTTPEKEEEWRRPWGNKRIRKDEENVRIQTININTFPRRGTAKMTMLRKTMEGTDITGMSEINRNHYKLDHIKGIGSNIKRWNKHSKTQIEWIRDRDWKHEFQQGGVSLTSQGNLREYIQDTGGDREGLGRWTWATYEGCDKIKTAVIQVYRPVRNMKDVGSTYNQQVARVTGDPIRRFDEDLEKLLKDFQEKGWRIVVMGDFNCNICKDNQITRCMEKLGLKDALKEAHDRGTPSTRKGSEVIDGIWTSEGLEVTQGGCLPGDTTLSDHRVEWVDITMASMLGERRGHKESAYRRRLHTNNKKAVKRYNEILQRQVKIHKLGFKAEQLWEEVRVAKKMTGAQRQRFEAIDDQRIRAMAHAEKKAIKLRSQSAVFSPTVQENL